MKDSKEREVLKERVKRWMTTSSVYKHNDVFDIMVLETFFYIYNSLENGGNIHEIGNELGVFPLP